MELTHTELLKELKRFEPQLKTGNVEYIVTMIKKDWEETEKTTLNIAVTGESGSGKSSLINELLGLSEDEQDGAETGVVETTMESTPYTYSKAPGVTVWDLPGIGTPNFKPKDYLEQVGLKKYDFFIIVGSSRFKENHANLAREINKMGKRFYFVRSKIDQDIYSAKKRCKDITLFDEEKILSNIRQDCEKNLRLLGITQPLVFLISAFDLQNYDFQELSNRLCVEMPEVKRDLFTLLLPAITTKVVQSKKDLLMKNIPLLSLASWGANLIPVRSAANFIKNRSLRKELSHYRSQFGLDSKSLQRLATSVGKSEKELRDVMTNPLPENITDTIIQNLLADASSSPVDTAENVISTLVPIVGGLVSGLLSAFNADAMLHKVLNQLADDCQKVLAKAFDEKIK